MWIGVIQPFGGIYRLSLQGRRVSLTRNQEKQAAISTLKTEAKFPQNIEHSPNYTTLQPRRLFSSQPPLYRYEILKPNKRTVNFKVV
jgi:hypothetical protein